MWKWSLTSVAVNLLLGVPAVVPIFLCWYFASNWPLAALGWTRGEPTENDGMLPWFLLGAPVTVGFALLWWLANYPVRRRVPLDSRLYWPAGALLTLAPTFVLMAVL
ncbi:MULTISPECIES: hypothetical protein [unclassified Streptomyces]|uniref:hypothetical protein n=1 Tax=unclassified Streptomyces TaxID=2593676 RepID=UPI00380D56D2